MNALAMRSEKLSEITPLLGGLVVMIAGALQFTSWKARALARCRHEECCYGSQQRMPRDALRVGVRLGLITVAISAERLTGSVNMGRAVGAAVLTSGILLVGRAILMIER